MAVSGTSGITTSPAAFDQAQFDATKRQITLNGQGLDVPRRTEGGPGGGPVWTNTVQTQVNAERELTTNGSNALRLAPAQFESTYEGGLLDQNFHLLNPGYSFVHVDFHA
ncbi:MAG: hypothetical protein JO247_09370 [Chloroflexi bacterium]|nr:hypothetical protein [Chloroflexota bacterium]